MGKRIKNTPLRQAGRIARKAAEIMEERGLNKGALDNPATGAVCFRGAFALAQAKDVMAGYGKSPEDATEVTSKKFSAFMEENYTGEVPEHWESFGIMGSDAAHWNDGVISSKEEGVSWLSKFADWADPQ